ncbi:thiol-disulfide oxidoreductase DCC family protein [Virgibacillus sp. FSP13]
MIVFYDSFCSMCRNSSIIWKKFDWNNHLIFESFRDLENYPKAMEENLHVKENGKWYVGFTALIQIAKHLPLLWILVPFLYFFKIIGLGDFIYKKVAANRKLIPVNQCDDKGCQLPTNKD